MKGAAQIKLPCLFQHLQALQKWETLLSAGHHTAFSSASLLLTTSAPTQSAGKCVFDSTKWDNPVFRMNRLCVPRAEIKIKILNKQEAQLPSSLSYRLCLRIILCRPPSHPPPVAEPGLLLLLSTTLRLNQDSRSPPVCFGAVQVVSSQLYS